MSALHVAGSKEGSTRCRRGAAQGAGLRVGPSHRRTSRWTERFRIGGAEVPEADLERAVERLRPEATALAAESPERAPTFFDATTAAALWLLAEARVDAAVVEVGLGGRLDSTNLVEPAVCCVTSIELEHTDLGDTLADRVREGGH